LAGHDGGTGLRGGKFQFADAATRAGAEQADVVGDLDEADGDSFERAAGFHGGIPRRLGFEMIFGLRGFEAGSSAMPSMVLRRNRCACLMPGPGVPPSAEFSKVRFDFQRRSMPCSTGSRNAESWPRRMGVASCRCVRPIFRTSPKAWLWRAMRVKLVQRGDELMDDGVESRKMIAWG